MTREELVEIVALVIALTPRGISQAETERCMARAALTALCNALNIPPAALDALATGGAVVVPVEPSEAMVQAGANVIEGGGSYASIHTEDAYSAMVAASPYVVPEDGV